MAWAWGPARVRVDVSGGPEAHLAGRFYPDALVPGGEEDGEVDLILEGSVDPIDGCSSFRVGPPEAIEEMDGVGMALSRFELLLSERLVQAQPGVRLHGGAVEGSHGALLLSGPGECGKSTFTAVLARSGYPVYGDDVVLLDPQSARVAPFPRLLKLSGDALAMLGRSPDDGPLGGIWEDRSLTHPGELGSRWAAPAPVVAILLPARDPGWMRTPVLESVPPGRAVFHLLEQTLLPEAGRRREFRTLASLADGVPVHRLRYRDAGDALPLIRELVGPPAPPIPGGAA